MLVFSYGSNMCLTRLQNRVSSAKFVATGKLMGHKLKFHKIGRKNGGSKANALYTQNDHDFIWGVVFDIDDKQKSSLNVAEGLGNGYDEKNVSIYLSDNNSVEAQIYVANESAIDDSLVPHDWYIDFVLSGAEDYKLPSEYIQELRNVQTSIDPDKERDKKERAILTIHKQKSA